MKNKASYNPAEVNGRTTSLVRDLRWFALTVPPQKEFAAQEILRRRGFVTFCPFESVWRRKSNYTKEKQLKQFPIMPRYVFLGLSAAPSWYHIFKIPLIVSVVGIEGQPAAIDGMPRVISLFSNGLRRPDAEKHMRTHHEYQVGDTVMVVDGALSERMVKVDDIADGHAFFRLELFGTERRLSLPVDKLEAA